MSGFPTPVGVTNESGGATVLCTRRVSRTQPRLQRLSQRQGKHASELPITILKMKKNIKMGGAGKEGDLSVRNPFCEGLEGSVTKQVNKRKVTIKCAATSQPKYKALGARGRLCSHDRKFASEWQLW